MNTTNKPTVVFSVVAAAAATLLVQFLAPKSEVQAAMPPLATHSYKVIRLPDPPTADQLQVFLNENAKDGWNLKQVVTDVAIYER